MSICEGKLIKLNERMDQPLPNYTREQISRANQIQPKTTVNKIKEQISERPDMNVKVLSNADENKKTQILEKEPLGETKESINRSCDKNPLLLPGNRDVKNQSLQKDKIKNRNIEPGSALSNINRNSSDIFGCFFQKRDSIKQATNHNDNTDNKRRKDSEGSYSKLSSPLINQSSVGSNKITDYFINNQNNPELASNDSDNLITNKNHINQKLEVSDMVLNQINAFPKLDTSPDDLQLSKYKLLIKDKDKEIDKLHQALEVKENEISSYKTKVKLQVSSFLLELEQMKKYDKKVQIEAQKLRIGEYVNHRAGAKFIETWVDGYELRNLKTKLATIQKDKENVEKIRREIQKKKFKTNVPNDKNDDLEVSDDYSCNLLDIDRYKMCAIYKSSIQADDDQLNLAENQVYINAIKERLIYQLQFLSKEEIRIKERIAVLEVENNNYLATSELMYEEDNSRFGRLNKENSLSWPFLAGKYQMLSLLGKGGFSEVYRAYDCIEMKFVACKIHQISPNWSEKAKSNYIKYALRENQVLKALNHPNIIRHYDSVEIDSNSFCTILEYCSGSDLATYLRNNKTLSEKEAKNIIRQILSALKFLNENDKKIIHYDLKPQNIMFHKGIIKISDFGLCKIIEVGETKVDLTSQGFGTYWYLPPECFNPKYPQISTKVDVWSIGVILYEMLFGYKPFGHNISQERILKEGIILNTKEVEFPEKPAVSDEIKTFIGRCLEYFQEIRIDVIEAWEMINKS